MSNTRSKIEKQARADAIQYAFFRWENAVVIGGTMLLMFFLPAPVPGWPKWAWPALGLLAVVLIVISSLTDTKASTKVKQNVLNAQYDLHMNGYELRVVEDTNAGRPVTSETSHVLSSNDWQIPIPWLIEGHYCATEEECMARRADPDGVGSNSLCWGHYSFDVVFQRTW